MTARPWAWALLLVGAIGASSPPPHNAAAKKLAPYLKPAHDVVLREWLGSNRYLHLRLAREEECTHLIGRTDLRKSLGAHYHPYYAVGDFNRDGVEDFAVALIDDRGSAETRGAMAVFNGPFVAGKPTKPAFFAGGLDFKQWGLFVWKDGLGQGLFETDEGSVFVPKGATYEPRALTDSGD